MADGLFEACRPETRAKGPEKFRDLSWIVLGFLTGATLAAYLAPRWLNHTLWFVEPMLVAVLLMSLRLRRESQMQGRSTAG